MKMQWMTAAVLSAALAVGCGGRDSDSTANPEQNPETAAPGTEQAVTPELPPPALGPTAPAPGGDTAGTPATSGNRTVTPARPAPATRPPSSVAEAPAAPARPAEPPRPVIRMVTIPAGTDLPLELTNAVSSETAQVETPVSARLRRDVVVNGETAIPAGSVFDGEVVEVERAGRVQGRARLTLRFTSVTIGNSREDLRTNPVVFRGEATKGEDATKVGAGAGIGAVIGGLLGGGDGAAKGAAIGGAAGAGTVLATRGREVALGAGADVDATLASEIEVRVR